MDYHSTILIFGCGESMTPEIQEKVPELVNNFVTGAVNNFPVLLNDETTDRTKTLPVDYWCALDEGMVNDMMARRTTQNLLINAHCTVETILRFKRTPHIPFMHAQNPTTELTEPLYLSGIFASAIPLCNYLLLLGYKNLILFGMDNKTDKDGNWKHFYSDRFNEAPSKKTINQIYKISEQFQELDKAFPNSNFYVVGESYLPFPRIDFQALYESKEIKEIP